MFFKSYFTLIGLSAVGVSAALLLYRFYKDNSSSRTGRRKSRKYCAIEVAVPQDSVSTVIGRGGRELKYIQSLTDTRIHFKEPDDNCEHRMCVIRGTSEGIQLAKSLIDSLVYKQADLKTCEMFVPYSATGRIIGRQGKTIRSIARASNAKITIERLEESAELQTEKKIQITGTHEQIKLAKLMIEEVIVEELEMRRKIEEGIQRRSPRRTTSEHSGNRQEQEVAGEKEGYMKVYISAVNNPGHFWMQVFGPRTVDLDQLIEQMTEFYSNEENRKLHVIVEPYVDQMVAAPFGDDGKWYRAKITNLLHNDNNEQVEIYYVDYGDSNQLPKEQVFSLRADFLMLRHQAIECTLADVKPKNNIWSEEAIESFDRLCHCAQWMAIMAKIKSYTEREGGSPIPVVELYGNNGSEDVSIGMELVKQGHAEETS